MTFLKNKLAAFLGALVFALIMVGCGQQESGETMEQATEAGKEMTEESKEKMKEGQ